jgi:hypothetical protein
MKIEHLDLWNYIILSQSSDCDGRHSSQDEFVSDDRPNEIVYRKADLFAIDGPSSVTLADGSTRDAGSAHVGHATDEGSQGFDIAWHRVTSKKVLDEFLGDIDSGKFEIPLYREHNLRRARIRSHVRELFPKAQGIGVNPGAAKGEPWTITEVYGDHQGVVLWEGDGVQMPFSAEVVREISADLEREYADGHPEPGMYVHI